MIIKKNLKSEMPNLKRCKAEVSGIEVDESCGNSKKLKTDDSDDYSLHLLGEIASGGIPINGYIGDQQMPCDNGGDFGSSVGGASLCTETSSFPGEVESENRNSHTRESNDSKEEVDRPPLVKTSRGRVRVIPSRFNDSVLDPWKKDAKSKVIESLILDVKTTTNTKKGKVYSKTPKFENQVKEGKLNYPRSNFDSLFGEGYEEVYDLDSRNLLSDKYSSSHSTLTLISDPLIEVEKSLVEFEDSPSQTKDFEDSPSQIKEFEDNFGIEYTAVLDGSSKKSLTEKRKGFYRPQDFISGDIVWAKCGKRYPAWPAIVIDPLLQAPDSVLKSCVAGAICVMFFGYSGNGKERDYAWVKHGMIFPFIDYVDRFQGETQLHRSKPSDFRMAIEEAFLVEHGFTEILIEGMNTTVGQPAYNQLLPKGIQEATDSNQDQECQSQNKDVAKDSRFCEYCGLSLPFKTAQKMKGSTSKGQVLCKHCTKLLNSKQYCGICKKIWHHSDGGSWVCCDGCKVWIHAECAKIPVNNLKNLADMDYYCPECKPELDFELPDSEKAEQKLLSIKSKVKLFLPDRIVVVCTGVEGIYFPSLHVVVCRCGSCGAEKMSPSEWERHTGSKTKNWKSSVKVKGLKQSLEEWVCS